MTSLEELRSDVVALAEKIKTDTFSADDILSLYKEKKGSDLPFEKHGFKTAIEFLSSFPFFAKTSTTRGIRFLFLKVERPLLAQKRPVEEVTSFDVKPPAKRVKPEPPASPPPSPGRNGQTAASQATRTYPLPRELNFANLVLFNTFEAVIDLLDICGGEATSYQLDHKSIELQGCPICVITSWDNIARECHRSPNPIVKVSDSPLTLRNPNYGKRTVAALAFKQALLLEDERRLKFARERILPLLSEAGPVSLDLVSDMYMEKHGVPLTKVEQRRLTGAENTEMFLSRLMGRNFEDSKIVYSLLPSGKYVLKLIRSEDERRQHRILQPPALLPEAPRPQGFVHGNQQANLPPPSLIAIPPISTAPAQPSAAVLGVLNRIRASLLSPPPPPPLPSASSAAPQPSQIPSRFPAPTPVDTRDAALPPAPVPSDSVVVPLRTRSRLPVPPLPPRPPCAPTSPTENPLSPTPQAAPPVAPIPKPVPSPEDQRKEALRTALQKWKDPAAMKMSEIVCLKAVARTIEALEAIDSKEGASVDLIQSTVKSTYGRPIKTVAKRWKEYLRMRQDAYPFKIEKRPDVVVDLKFGLKSLAQEVYVEAVRAEFDQRLEVLRTRLFEILPESGADLSVTDLFKEYKKRYGLSPKFTRTNFLNLAESCGDEEFCTRIEGDDLRNTQIIYVKNKKSGEPSWRLRRGKKEDVIIPPMSKKEKKRHQMEKENLKKKQQEKQQIVSSDTQQSSSSAGNQPAPEDPSQKKVVSSIPLPADAALMPPSTAKTAPEDRPTVTDETDPAIRALVERMMAPEDISLEILALINTVARFADLINRNGGTASFSEMQKLNKAVYGRGISREMFARWKDYKAMPHRFPFEILISGVQPVVLQNLHYGRKHPLLTAYLDQARAEFEKRMELTRRRVLVLLSKFGPLDMETLGDRYGFTFFGASMTTKRLFGLANVDTQEEFCRRIEGDDIYEAKAIFYVENNKMLLACANAGLVSRIFTESGIDEATRRRFRRAAEMRASKKAGAPTTTDTEAEVIDIDLDGDGESLNSTEPSGTAAEGSPLDSTQSATDAAPNPVSSPNPQNSEETSSSTETAMESVSGGGVDSTAPAAVEKEKEATVADSSTAINGSTGSSSSDMEIDEEDQSEAAQGASENDATAVTSSAPTAIPAVTQNGGDVSSSARKRRAVDPQLIGEEQNTVAPVASFGVASTVRRLILQGVEVPRESPAETGEAGSFRTPPLSPDWNSRRGMMTPMDTSLEDGEIRSESSVIVSNSPTISVEPVAMDIEGDDVRVQEDVEEDVSFIVPSEASEVSATTSPALPAESAIVSAVDDVIVSSSEAPAVVESESTGSLLFVDASSSLIPDPPTPISPRGDVIPNDENQKTVDSEVPSAAASSPLKGKFESDVTSMAGSSSGGCGNNEEKFKLASNMVLMALRDAERRGEDTDALIHRMFAALYGK